MYNYRWVEHCKAFKRFNQMLYVIVLFLDYKIESSNGQVLKKVNGLYNSILKFEITNYTMICILSLSRKLQSPIFDIFEA